jgi:hypothetical protein
MIAGQAARCGTTMHSTWVLLVELRQRAGDLRRVSVRGHRPPAERRQGEATAYLYSPHEAARAAGI